MTGIEHLIQSFSHKILCSKREHYGIFCAKKNRNRFVSSNLSCLARGSVLGRSIALLSRAFFNYISLFYYTVPSLANQSACNHVLICYRNVMNLNCQNPFFCFEKYLNNTNLFHERLNISATTIILGFIMNVFIRAIDFMTRSRA